jgi:CBS-domain-containing membrane protein
MKSRRGGVAAAAVLVGTAVAMAGNPWVEWPVIAIAGAVFIGYQVKYRVVDRRRR